jgi:hypothetical protein
MRLARWFAAFLAVLAVGLLVAAWLVPPMLDWNRYRGDLARLASDRMGRQVRIEGPVTLQLLPQPVLTASNITVDEAGGGVAVSVAQLRLRVGLGALFRGKVDARELVLHGADMRVPWPLPPDAFELITPAWLSALSARIEDSRVSIGSMSVTGIDATLATAENSGSYMAAGTAQISGHAWHFTARLSQPGGDGSAGIDATLDGQGNMQGDGAVLSGQLLADGTLTGRVSGRGPDLSQLLPAPAIPFRADGRVSVAAGLIAADELNVDLGGSPARGAIALRVTPALRVDVALTASRLDLGAWLTAVLRGTGHDALPHVPVSIDLSAEAAGLAGGTLRGLRGAFDVADGAVVVRELRATLPGDAAMRVSGGFTVPDSTMTPARIARFDGYAAVTAPDLRTTLGWLRGAGIDLLDQLPAGVLRSGQFAGHTVIEPGQLAIDQLTGTLDGTAATGSVTVRLADPVAGTRLRIGAGLTLDRVELDPLLPADGNLIAAIPRWLAISDLDLRLDAKQALLRGLAIAPLSIDAGVESGHLTLRKLDALAAGVHVAASGTLGDDLRLSEGRLDVQAQQAQPLTALLPSSLSFLTHANSGFWRQPATIQLLAAGPPQSLGLRVTADVGDLRIEAQPTLDLPGVKSAGSITLRHPGAARLAESFGLGGAPAWLGDGSLSLLAQVGVGGGRLTADNIELIAGALHAGGSLTLQGTETGPSLTGHLTAETLPLPLPYGRSPSPLPLDLLAGWQASVTLDAAHVLLGNLPSLDRVSATLTLNDGVFRAQGLTAAIGGGAVTASLSVDSHATPPVFGLDAQVATAALSGPLLDLPLDLLSGTLDATAALTATGYSPAALLASLAGSLHLTARAGSVAGVDLAAATAAPNLTTDNVNKALAGGATSFDLLDLQGKIQHGSLSLDQTRLAAPSGTMSAAGTIDLPSDTVDVRLGLMPDVPDPPTIGLRLTGPFDSLIRTPELADLVRWRARPEAHAR